MSNSIHRRSFLKAGGAATALGWAGFLRPSAADAASLQSTLAGQAPGLSALAIGSSQLAALLANPTARQKSMTRTWFPDSELGSSSAGLAYVAEHVKLMAAAGFGGAEIAMPSDDSDYTNAEAKTIGFGTPNWKNQLRTFVKTANSVEGGFALDLTLSSHWPVAVNVIDPNDDGQQQEVATAYAKITSADLTAGTVALPLPAARTSDGNQAHPAPFVFAYRFEAATVAKVSAVSSTGTPTFELASLVDVSGQTSAITVSAAVARAAPAGTYKEVNGVWYTGNAAGVPDEAWWAAHGTSGVSYQDGVVALWGPDPSNPNFPGKIDSSGDRKRMADWQFLYDTKLAAISALKSYVPSSGTALAVGDYVLYGIYRQGTGQVQSGGAAITQYNRPYCIDIYSRQGTQAISDFWYEKILDREMIALLRENARQHPRDAVFEDSFEISHTTALWPAGFLQTASSVNGYKAGSYALVYALNSAASFDDTTTAGRLLEDYQLTLNYGYENAHIKGIEKFAAAFGFTFKNQSEAGGAGIAGAEPGLGVVEGDNASGDEGFRNMAGAVNVAGTNLLSNEALTFVASDYGSTWITLEAALNDYWGVGVNRVNLHGTPFSSTFDGFNSAWPGWNFIGLGVFAPRQTWWEDADEFAGFIARTQSILQTGVSRVDLAVLEGTEKRFTLPNTVLLPLSLNLGYSYNILDETMLAYPGAAPKRGVIGPDGPAYKALIVNDAQEFSVAGLQRIIACAQAGVPVVLLDCDITRVYGTSKPGNSDTVLASLVTKLKATKNVYSVSTEAEMLSYLASIKIKPAASYSAAGLLSGHRQDGGVHFYYLYSEGTTLTAAAAAGATSLSLASTTGLSAGQQLIVGTSAASEVVTVASVTSTGVTLSAGLASAHASGAAVSATVATEVTLAGSGTPYVLDAWTGQVQEAPLHVIGNGTVTLPVTLIGGSAAIIALAAPDGRAGQPYATSVTGDGAVVYDKSGKLVLRATAAGSYSVALSKGGSKKVTVSAVPAAPSLTSWDLSLRSWGPNPAWDATAASHDAPYPPESIVTTVSFSGIGLGDWSALPTTNLTKLGVTSMADVSGIGTYTTSFTLPSTWTTADGAYLQLAHGSDMVTAVTVNGKTITNIDQFSDKVDLGGCLAAGKNTLSVKLDTTLASRVTSIYGATGGLGGGINYETYGLTGAVLMPYVDAAL